MARYQVTEDSDYISHGCCYSLAIVDTETPTMIGDKVYRPFSPMAEVSERDDADLIAAALNAYVEAGHASE